MTMKTKDKWLIAAGAGIVAGATAAYLLWPKKDVPGKATVVQPFDMNRYLGKWYEIARLPNKPEEHVQALTETYTRRKDGMIGVLTRAFDTQKRRWVKATGKIKLAAKQNLGKLKVSYFGPFYFTYNILDIDEDYRYALASGSNLDQLWLLSRERTMPEVIRERFLNHARGVGFNIDKLEWPQTA
jgi:apolipoprotein D and lipocalin family protein